MADSEEERPVTDWRTESRFYRRQPGGAWLLAFLAVPVLLALIGLGFARPADTGEPSVPAVAPTATLSGTSEAPTSSTAAAAPLDDYPAWSIVRSANEFRVTGRVPDEQTRKGLIDTLRLVLPGAGVVDELSVAPGVRMPDVAGLGGLFSAAVGIPDFALQLDGGTVTLTGVAPAEPVRASAETYAKTAFADVAVINDIEVAGGSSAPPPRSTPVPARAGACGTLRADIAGLLTTPITFDTNGASLAAASRRVVRQIADEVKACPAAKLTVTGHTDSTGNDAVNTPLSADRAEAVAEALVAGGVFAANVTSGGAGASAPVASDATPEGRAQNRRVEITVS